jgi:hypothetical protein
LIALVMTRLLVGIEADAAAAIGANPSDEKAAQL